jgi:hypothetical protein
VLHTTVVHFYGYSPSGVGYSPPGIKTAITEASIVWALENLNLGLEQVREELRRKLEQARQSQGRILAAEDRARRAELQMEMMMDSYELARQGGVKRG